jgi:hypothetical protein
MPACTTSSSSSFHLIVTVVRLIKPGGLRAVVAESALTRHQLLILNRSRKQAPNPRVSDRLIAGLCTLLMHPSCILRCGIVLKPSTLLHFHDLLTKRKYQMLFSSKRGGRPGPKRPAQELIDAVVEMKRRNPTWVCPRIAQQIALALAWTSTRTWYAGFLEYITGQSPDLVVRLGSPFSVRRRTVCGASTCFVVNR